MRLEINPTQWQQEVWEQRASRFRLWEFPDDPFTPKVWTNPYLPMPWRGRVYSADWDLLGLIGGDGWHPHEPPPVRAELTSEQWALWWDQQWNKPELEFPRPWSPDRRRWLGLFTPFVFMFVLDREEENNLVAQARGRIRFREGVTDGLRIVHTEENRSPGPIRRRHGAKLSHRGRSKSGRR